MTKLKHLIERIFTKKSIKMFLLLFIFVGFFVGTSFAQSDTTEKLSMVQKLTHLIHIGISILSWGWVMLAALAGKFMTNDFVYGTFLNLDSSLWKLWNMVKNFANFTLGFVLIFSIVKNLFGVVKSNSSPLNDSLKTVGKVLVAGVLIQMSWFLVAALLDISTIGTAAVGALPSQFIASNSGFQGNMKTLLGKTQATLEIDFTTTGDIVNAIKTGNLNTEDDVAKLLDTIMPSSNSMVGSFIFLGASVFNLYDLTDTSKTMSGTDDIADLFLSLGINGFVLFSFSIMLMLIFIFNLFRVVTLWVIIPLVPFVIVVAVFFKGKNDKIKGFVGDVLNYEKILKLIFKPVYMTLVLSIVLIVMVLVRTLVKADNGNLDLTEQNNITIESKKIGTGDNVSYDSSLSVGDIVNVNMKLKDSIVDVFVYILCLILLVILMKSCVSGEITGISFIDEKINGLSKMMWGGKGEFGGLLGTVGVLPLGKDDNGKTVNVGLGKVWDYAKEGKNRLDTKLEEKMQKQDSAVRKAWGLDKISGSFDSLKYIVDTPEERDQWLEEAVEIGKRKGYRIKEDWGSDESFTEAARYFNDKNINSTKGISSVDAELVVKKMEEMEKEENGEEK